MEPTREPDPAHRPAPVDIAEESVAGEEDPGASVEPPRPLPADPPPQPAPGARPPAPRP